MTPIMSRLGTCCCMEASPVCMGMGAMAGA